MYRNFRLVVALIHLPFTTLFAQNDSASLDDLIVSGNRLQSSLNHASRSYEVKLKKELKLISGVSINDWLGNINGVDLRQRGPNGVQADVGIRGGSFDQTQVLLNGMKLNDPQTGHHMLNLPFTQEAIEQIEVIKSGASRLYGINALTGSVNFITRVPHNNMLYLGAFAGDFGLQGMQGGVAWHSGKLAQHLSLSQSKSSGYKSNSDFDIQQAFYQGTYSLNKNGKLDLLLGYAGRNFGASGFYVANSHEYEMTKTSFGSLQYLYQKNNLKIRSLAYLRYNDDEYHYLREKPTYYKNHHYTQSFGVELHGNYSSVWGQTGIGLESRTENIASNNLGHKSRHIAGIYAEHRFQILGQKLLITPGIHINMVDGQNAIYLPGIDASYYVNAKNQIFASTDKGMRLPTYTDWYYQGPSNTGNAHLKAEEALSMEVGYRYKTKTFQASAALFQRSSNNLIDWVRVSDTVKWQAMNLHQASFRGIESQLVYILPKKPHCISLNYTFTDAQFHQPENYLSRYTLSHIKHQLILSAHIQWFKGMVQSIGVRHINRVSMTDYTLVDTKLNYSFRNFVFYADLSNVFDVKYFENIYVQMPGRWIKIGLQYALVFPTKK